MWERVPNSSFWKRATQFRFKKTDLKSNLSNLQNLNKIPDLQLSELPATLLPTTESCRIQSNLMNDEELRSFHFLKLKCRRRGQIIQLFYRIGSPQKLGLISSISINFQNMRKVLLSHAESIKYNEWQNSYAIQLFKTEIQKWGPNNSAARQNSFPKRN